MANCSGSLSAYLDKEVPEWKDEHRISGLFGSFTGSREINPEAWDGRVAFWERVLTETSARGFLSENRLTIDSTNLAAKFERRGTTPLGLAVVLVS